MKDDVNDKYMAGIRDLIRKEQEQALRLFRKKDFHARLQARLQSESRKANASLLWFRRPASILAVLFLFLITCIALVKTLIFFSKDDYRGAIEQVLSNSANLRGITTRQEVGATQLKTSEFSVLEKDINQYLLALSSEINASRDEVAVLGTKLSSPRYNLEQKFRILIIEKKVQAFLETYAKNKEV